MTVKLLIFAVAVTAVGAAPSCETEARAWRGSGKSTDRAALETCATRMGSTAGAATARLTMAVAAIEAGRYVESMPYLQKARRPALQTLDDYLAFFEATALAGQGQHKEAITALAPVWKQRPVSPVLGRAAMVAAKSYLALGQPAAAAQILEKYETQIPQPQGDFAAGEAWLAAGNRENAGTHFSRVYFQYPQSAESARVAAEWRKGVPADYWLRADRCSSDQASAIRAELTTASAGWSAEDRELAQVKGWELAYRARKYADVRQELASLSLTTASADAERSWWLYQTARRMDLDADREAAFRRLAMHHPTSPRYLEALLAEGYRYLTDNDHAAYEPMYSACVEHFPSDPKAAFCHWKLVWSSYLRKRADTEKLLREHLEKFPNSENANTALYFLGRLAEQRGEWGAARFYYETIGARFINTYYALIADERMEGLRVKTAPAPAAIKQWVEGLRWNSRTPFSALETAEAKLRRDRASLLASAGLDNYAEFELRMGARQEKAPVGLAMDLADHMTKIGQLDKGLRYIKGLLPGYLYFPWEAAGGRFWRLAFPLPYQSDVIRYAREHDVDPFIVAGLIRQESEFNAKVVSRANAYGLTQILPSTGRDLSRRVGLRGFQTSMLYDPAVNLRLGTYYLKILLRSFDGRWEDVLAAYNGGGTRVRKWRKFATFDEPAEFIETIPFDETRNYVQSVLRNASVYRRLYEDKLAAINSSNEPPARITAQPPAKPRPAIRKKPVPKRKNR